MNVDCTSPSYVADMHLPDVDEVLMSCGDKEILEDPKYDILPDVKYRNLE